jgi:chemotaxis protein CheD
MTALRVDGEHRVNIVQGEFYVTKDPSIVLTTLLGSCVAACIRDPEAGVGGMNHFLLPGQDGSSNNRESESYGVHLMELLVNGLLKQGARRERLEAKLFGGARTMEALSDIGAKNGRFAEKFLRYEGINYIGGSLGGEGGRRLQFWPVAGRARQSLFGGEKLPAAAPKLIVPAKPADSGAIEFF